jgi:hypothetical protein
MFDRQDRNMEDAAPQLIAPDRNQKRPQQTGAMNRAPTRLVW